MSPKKRARRQYTDARKAKLVSQALKTSTSEVAEKNDLSPGTLSRWVRDPRYGGVNEEHVRPGTLPTTRRVTRRKRALVATGYMCPHCGGPITTEA